MKPIRSIFTKVFCMAVFALLLFSCHSNNGVVSSWGKRKYMKGYYWNRHGNIKDNKGSSNDSTPRNKRKVVSTPEKQTIEPPPDDAPVVVEVMSKHKHSHRNKDSIRQSIAAERASVASSADNKAKPPPEPKDDYSLRLLIMITVLAGFALFITGLITPIVIWGITQNFLLVAGVCITFFGFCISVDQKLGINLSRGRINSQPNIGKPAFALSCWGSLLMAFLIVVVKTSLLSDLILVPLATIGMFFAAVCILLSLILAIKALCVHDRHKGKAILAIFIDAIVIAVSLLLLF